MKLLFTDLDGTLLTDDKQILDVDMSAISKMLEEGHKLVLCTGRPLTSAKMLAKRYGFDRPGFFLVSFNGGLIYDYATEKSILTRRISVDDVKFIMDRAHECGMHAHTYAGECMHTPMRGTWWFRSMRRNSSRPIAVLCRWITWW